MELIKRCKTCEFNFDGICAGYGETYAYGEKIVNKEKGCSYWSASFEYYSHITSHAPWYIKDPLNNCDIPYQQFLELIEADHKGEAIEVNIFDVIKHIYGISLDDIAMLMGISIGVVCHAKSRGVPAKRIYEFSDTLCIRPALFRKTTTHDFAQLEECRRLFQEQTDIDAVRDRFFQNFDA